MGLIMRGHLFPLALCLALSLMACMVMPLTNITTDESALLSLKSRLITLDPSHDILSKNWSDSISVCSWIGVTCSSRHQRVTALDISTMGLTGNLPPEMGNLSFLVFLNLSGNGFQGSLTQELSQLRRLRAVDFGFNNFTGEIPSWFGFLSELQFLNLGNNSFGGFLPSSISNISKLETLDLSFNYLEGNIPEEIGNLYNLKRLSLKYNKFSGSIPKGIGNLTALEMLYLPSNNLTGEIPEELGNLHNLKELIMGDNSLVGSVPPSLFNISSVRYLNLITNSLTGVIPPEICSHPSQLEKLHLYENELVGDIPERIGECSALQSLDISMNYLTGNIPKGVGNLTMLQNLYLGQNIITGTIPEEIGNLYKLERLHLANNSLMGPIPAAIFNMTALQMITVAYNELSGYLPSDFGYGLPNLENIYLNDNNLSGEIPHSVANASKLTLIVFSTNNFSGLIPNSFGELNFLQDLYVAENNFVSESSEISFVTSLTKCRYLRKLQVHNNLFSGILPLSVGNLSTSLEDLIAYNCGLRGIIPDGIGNLTGLTILSLTDNQLTGSIPKTLVNLQNLQGLALLNNSLNGPIPDALCGMQYLEGLVIDQNQINGSIPDCIYNLTSMRYLNLGFNNFNSGIPTSLWQLSNLLQLNLSSSSLTGSLPPDIGNLKALTRLDLSKNQFSGTIPTSIGDLRGLLNLSLAHNRFQGSIPQSIGKISILLELDLSHNKFSGNIPKSLEKLQDLTDFDVSFNDLSGEIPSGGPFENFSSQSFVSNEGLCGDPRYGVPPCKSHSSKKRRKILPVVYALLGVSALVFILVLAYAFKRFRKKEKVENENDLLAGTAPLRASYYDLRRVTEGFSESHLLGTGGFSSVYKGTLENELDVAIKVFNLELEGAFKSFDTECEALRSLRHRNLCKVIGACSNEDFKALLLEYMPNGSLEKWLYSEDRFLDIRQRISIMIDVASALEYLHHGLPTPTVHCDIKPSNVLLDEDMIGHLSDFGIAKLLGEDTFVHTTTLATLGYIAPEYGSEGLVSTRCDVYSFGIMLMEVFTNMKPSSERFAGDLSLRNWVDSCVPDAVTRIMDPKLLNPEEEHFSEKLECLSSIFELALKCSKENPNERIGMEDIVVSLKKVSIKLLAYFQNTGNNRA